MNFKKKIIAGTIGCAAISFPLILAACGDQRAAAVRGEVGDHFPGLGIRDHGPDGHPEDDVLPGLPVAVGSHAVLAGWGNELLRVPVVDQGVDVLVADSPHRAASSAVPAVRAAAGNELLAPEGCGTVAAVTALHVNPGFVNEFHS